MASLRVRARATVDLSAAFVRSTILSRRDRNRFDAVETYCMFIGHPRSGHSVVGSLLDAHPEAVIAHELDALRYFQSGLRRNQVFSLIVAKAASDAARGRKANAKSGEYVYAVPGQWQGRYTTLRVIGDKKGGVSTRRMLQDPGLLARVRREVGLPMRFVNVTRNPFDNIATMHGKARDASLDRTIADYFTLCAGVARTHHEAPGEVVDFRHEDLLRDPETVLRRVCEFVGLTADDAYLAACAATLFDTPKQTRAAVAWSPQQIAHVEAQIGRFGFLAGYSFGS